MKFLPSDTNIDFISKSKYALVLSVLLVAFSVYTWVDSGAAKYGVDYKGGTELVLKVEPGVTAETIRTALSENGYPNPVVQAFEASSREYSVRVGGKGSSEQLALSKVLSAGMGQDKFEVIKTDYVGPTIGAELRKKAQLAVILALIGMLIYISVRFELAFALGAVAALFHDVIICLGIYVLSGREINVTTLAAALTIVGYSVNDTIIIFDRCREELSKRTSFDLPQLLNSAINRTLARTLITSILTLFSALALFLFGGGAIADLSFFLVAGVIAGTYSTIFVACPVVVMWEKFRASRGSSEEAVARKAAS